jgi:hypothetical protein
MRNKFIFSLFFVWVIILLTAAQCPGTQPPGNAEITAVTIRGNGTSTQVRQGGTITLEVTGKNLTNVVGAKLGDIAGTKGDNNDTLVVLTFNIPADEEIGAKTLSFSTDNGNVSESGAVTVTHITISPSGDDASGKGTGDSPYKSLKKAVEGAGEGSSISLKNGTYTGIDSISISTKLSIIGESETDTILQGVSTAATQKNCLLIQGKVTIQNLTLSKCWDAIQQNGPGDVTLDRVNVSDNLATGFWAINAPDSSIAISNARFNRNGHYGIGIANSTNNSEVTISNTEASSNTLEGIAFFSTNSTFEITNSVIKSNKINGIVYDSLATSDTSQLSIIDTEISGNTVNGIILKPLSKVDVVLSGLTVSGNNSDGIEVMRAVNTFTLRDSKVIDNFYDGIWIFDTLPTQINLGDGTTPGNNTIKGNGSSSLDPYAIRDGRSFSAVIITAYGNDFGGPGTLSGVKTGPATDPDGRYRIITSGNKIDFGP